MTQAHDTNPELYFAEDGAPRSGRFGDIYYSLEDGLEETRHVFFHGCGLPDQWAGRRQFSVAELGFGTGLNIAALLELWSKTRPNGAHLHIFSVEGFLITRDEAARALSAFESVSPFTNAVLKQWPGARRGFHYMDFPEWGASLTLALMPVTDALTAWQGKADAWFLDGFSPALNPDMWSDHVCQAIAEHSQPGARLATFTAASAVRRALSAAGFEVEKTPGYGRKRERLVARFAGQAEATPARRQRIAIIGAGIAGACAAWHTRQLGHEAIVFDADGAGSGASGNPAALMTPRLDAGAGAISSLFADSAYYARDFYARVAPEAVTGQGVDIRASKPKDAQRFEKIITDPAFVSGDIEVFAAPALGPELPELGLHVKPALGLRPAAVIAALLDGHDIRSAKIVAIEGEAGAIALTDSQGQRFEGFDAVCLCLGEGVLDWPGLDNSWELKAVRGQMEMAEAVSGPEGALSWGGYYLPLDQAIVFGATHDRDDRGRDIRPYGRLENLASLAEVDPQLARSITPETLKSRASIRVMTRDYLPILTQIGSGCHVLTGLGARGFCLAPMLAKAMVHAATRCRSPLSREVQSRVETLRIKPRTSV